MLLRRFISPSQLFRPRVYSRFSSTSALTDVLTHNNEFSAPNYDAVPSSFLTPEQQDILDKIHSGQVKVEEVDFAELPSEAALNPSSIISSLRQYGFSISESDIDPKANEDYKRLVETINKLKKYKNEVVEADIVDLNSAHPLFKNSPLASGPVDQGALLQAVPNYLRPFVKDALESIKTDNPEGRQKFLEELAKTDSAQRNLVNQVFEEEEKTLAARFGAQAKPRVEEFRKKVLSGNFQGNLEKDLSKIQQEFDAKFNDLIKALPYSPGTLLQNVKDLREKMNILVQQSALWETVTYEQILNKYPHWQKPIADITNERRWTPPGVAQEKDEHDHH